MNLCFRGSRNSIGQVLLFTGAFCATFATGYLVSGRGFTERTPVVDKPVATVVKKIETVETKDFCDRSAPSLMTDRRLEIISKPRANYTDAARANMIQGTVTLSVTFEVDGEIGLVQPVWELPHGLTQSAVAAAKGIKFIPAVRDGEAVSTTKTVEYTFSIY